jgi:hypothetical protein
MERERDAELKFHIEAYIEDDLPGVGAHDVGMNEPEWTGMT